MPAGGLAALQHHAADVDRKAPVETAVLRNVTDGGAGRRRGAAEQCDAAAGRRQQAEDQVQQGALAGAVGADQNDEVVGGQYGVQVVEHHLFAAGERQVFEDDGRRGAHCRTRAKVSPTRRRLAR